MKSEPQSSELQALVDSLGAEVAGLRQANAELEERNRDLRELLAAKNNRVDELMAEMARREEQLASFQVRQTELTRQLLDNNKALAMLARSLDGMRLESEQGMARRIQAMTVPILERLGRDDRLGRLRDELNVVVEELEDLAAGIGDGEGLLGRLTISERRIAAMIKCGLSSKQIAANLSISLDTVKTHRRNIRRKLRINDSGASLRGFLQARMGRLDDDHGPSED